MKIQENFKINKEIFITNKEISKKQWSVIQMQLYQKILIFFIIVLFLEIR